MSSMFPVSMASSVNGHHALCNKAKVCSIGTSLEQRQVSLGQLLGHGEDSSG